MNKRKMKSLIAKLKNKAPRKQPMSGAAGFRKDVDEIVTQAAIFEVQKQYQKSADLWKKLQIMAAAEQDENFQMFCISRNSKMMIEVCKEEIAKIEANKAEQNNESVPV